MSIWLPGEHLHTKMLSQSLKVHLGTLYMSEQLSGVRVQTKLLSQGPKVLFQYTVHECTISRGTPPY